MVRILIAFSVLLLIIVVPLSLTNIDKFEKLFPKHDPYKLEKLESERIQLFDRFKKGENSSEIYYELALSAFRMGEIYESDYFLSKCKTDDQNVISLRSKVNAFKSQRSKLEKSLYDNGKYFNEFAYPDSYPIINAILELDDQGYIHVRHLFLKGYLLLKEGRRTEARVIFDDLSRNGGKLEPTSSYLYAKTFVNDNNERASGIEPFKEYIELYPDSRLAPLASANLAIILNSLNTNREALEILNDAIKKHGSSEYLPDLLLEKEKAIVCVSGANSKDAEQVLLDTLRRFPKNQYVFARALEVYDGWEKKLNSTKNNEVLLEVANVLIENARYFQPKKLLDSLAPNLKGKELSYAGYLTARCLSGTSNYDNALKKCNEVIKACSDNNLKSQTYQLMARIYAIKKDVQSVENYYLKSVELNASDSDFALREIARTAYDIGWRDKAWNYYSKLVDKFPNSPYLSEALNYLVVMSFYKEDYVKTELYASKLAKSGTNFEDRLKGNYYLWRIKKGDLSYAQSHPLAFFSFNATKTSAEMFLLPEKAYPSVNTYKDNLGWEYFMAGCYDLAEKEFQFQNNSDNPYSKMALCYLAYFHKEFRDGIILTRDFMDGNFQSQIEKGYAMYFYHKAYPMDYVDIIEEVSAGTGFSPPFVLSIIRQESFFNTKIKSSAGALGLMQIMPSTGEWIHKSIKEKGKFELSSLTNPERNLKFGLWYLGHLREQLGREPGMILAGHNAGPGNLKKWKAMFPVYETDKVLFYELIPSRQNRNFIRAVLVNQRIYDEIYRYRGDLIYF